MPTETERERKFLVVGDAWRDQARDAPVTLVQGYLHVDDDSEIRVRLRGDDDAVLTVKRGGRVEERAEVEVALGLDAARRLMDEATVGTPVRKRRHLVDLPAVDDGPALVAEVDEFTGGLEGLVVAEVELPGPSTPVPEVEWLGREVTGDPAYYNAMLATAGRP